MISRHNPLNDGLSKTDPTKELTREISGQLLPSSQGLKLYLCFLMGLIQGVPLFSV